MTHVHNSTVLVPPHQYRQKTRSLENRATLRHVPPRLGKLRVRRATRVKKEMMRYVPCTNAATVLDSEPCRSKGRFADRTRSRRCLLECHWSMPND